MIPEIPFRMQKLPRDARGYPIPVIVKYDSNGVPQFTVNDQGEQERVVREDRCAICGDRLLRGRWFIGGSLSAFHEAGAYFDSPVHAECKTFALQACPWLAAPKYTKRVAEAKAKDVASVTVDHTVIPNRPDPFVAVMARGQRVIAPGGPWEAFRLKPARPYLRVEFWRAGARLPHAEGQELADAVLREHEAIRAARPPEPARSTVRWRR